MFGRLRLVGEVGELPETCHARLDRGIHPDLDQLVWHAPPLDLPGRGADVVRQKSGIGFVGLGYPKSSVIMGPLRNGIPPT